MSPMQWVIWIWVGLLPFAGFAADEETVRMIQPSSVRTFLEKRYFEPLEDRATALHVLEAFSELYGDSEEGLTDAQVAELKEGAGRWRASALECLSQSSITEAEVVLLLKKVLGRDGDSSARRKAIQVFARLNGSGAYDGVLEDVAASDLSSENRELAKQSLKSCRSRLSANR